MIENNNSTNQIYHTSIYPIKSARIARLAYLQLDELRQIVQEIKNTDKPSIQVKH